MVHGFAAARAALATQKHPPIQAAAWVAGWFTSVEEAVETEELCRIFTGIGSWESARHWLLSELNWLAADLPGSRGDEALRVAAIIYRLEHNALFEKVLFGSTYYLRRYNLPQKELE